MGSCHIEIYESLLRYILNNFYDIKIISFHRTGEFNSDRSDEIIILKIYSPKLSEEYHGIMNFILEDSNSYKLKKEIDT
jgi:transcription initiation factor IIE alpha subunit